MHETWLSKKKTEGFSKFLQCYDLSTGVLSEINSFRALFLAKKIHKKKGDMVLHTLIILNNANAWGWVQSEDACHVGGRDKRPYGVSPAGPSQLPSTLRVHQPT